MIFCGLIGSLVLFSAIVGGCLIGSLVLDAKEGPDVNSMYWVNTMRDSFTCSPRFSGILLAGDFTHGAYILFLSKLFISFRFNVCCLIPHVIEFVLEIIFVEAHFIACGAAMVMSVISIFLTLRRVLNKSGVQPTPHFESTSLTLNQRVIYWNS